MHFDWESLTDSVCRCRLPFLDVTVGLVQGSAGALSWAQLLITRASYPKRLAI
jgi:hypothetical protein